jgi:hypothetical protein
MDQFWIYVIIAIIYGLSALLKKKNPADDNDSGPSQERRSGQPQTGTGPERQLTFEELLKEITEGKPVSREAPKPVSQPTQTYVDYDDDIEDEESKQEPVVDYDDERSSDRVFAAYEEAKRMAFERPSLEESMKLSDTEMKFGKFKEFEQTQERNLLKEYLIDFNDPAGWKRAIVMSEILKRKF